MKISNAPTLEYKTTGKTRRPAMKRNIYNSEKIGVFLAPNKTILGKDAVLGIAQEIKTLGGNKTLIVTDPGVRSTGLVSMIEDLLKAGKIGVGVYDMVIPEPPARLIDEASGIARSGNYDVIIGIGGGSSLDVAKGVAAMATNEGQILDYVGVNAFRKRGIPLILIPTTAGTGSEASWVCVVTDEKENTKKSLYSNVLLASVSFLDPMFTLSMPPLVTADTGFDALVHAIESYVSVNATPYTKIMALEAVSLIARSLPVAYAKGTDVAARYNMLLASNLAGMAFTSGGLGATHGLSYPLGTEYHMSHGRSNAIMLPHVMRFNEMGNLQGYADIAVAMGENIDGLGMYEAGEKSVQAVEKLLRRVHIPYALSAYGIKAEDIPKLVDGGMKQSRFFIPNPRNLTEYDIKSIYQNAL
jgi:alcohol dehydrogenase